MPAIVMFNPRNPTHALLASDVVERIRVYSAEHDRDTDPVAYAAQVMSRLWAADPSVRCLLLVEPETARVVGHVLAFLAKGDGVTKVTTVQRRADQNVGDGLAEAIRQIEAWGKSEGAPSAYLFGHRDGIEKKMGYTKFRSVCVRALNDPAGDAV